MPFFITIDIYLASMHHKNTWYEGNVSSVDLFGFYILFALEFSKVSISFLVDVLIWYMNLAEIFLGQFVR